MTRTTIARAIICTRCGKEDMRKGNRVKYCHACSFLASKDHKRVYARKNNDDLTVKRREYAAQKRPEYKKDIAASGLERSTNTNISDIRPKPFYEWVVRFSVPFTYAASKNHIYGWGHHVHKRKESRDIQTLITLSAKSALRGRDIKQNKIWIGIYVEKPNNRGDAINVVDLVCDGLKEAIGVDDRWFCIDFIDWSINKNDPKLLLQIAQEAVEDAQACSACGHLLPFSDFSKSKDAHNGIGRTCKKCLALAGQKFRQRRANPAPLMGS